MNILFVTWDGPQTNYLESLFLPIFSKLENEGYHFSILQFSWATKEQVLQNTEQCKKFDIEYKHINVWRKPNIAIGSLLSAINGSLHIRKAIKDWDIDIVMSRSTLPSLATLIAIKNNVNIRWVFDADGLPLDERVDFYNVNSTSLVHRFLRDIETQSVIRASKVITRSKIANQILQNRAGAGCPVEKFSVVSNGRNSELFKIYGREKSEIIRSELGVDINAPLLVYAGSLGPQYCIKQMLLLFSFIKKELPLAKFLVLSGDHSYFEQQTNTYEYLQEDIIFKSLRSHEVAKYISACDLGLAIRQPSFSMQAVAPIKLGEYLLCGLPVVATKEIGDTDMIKETVGFLLGNNNNNEIVEAANWFVKSFNEVKFDKKLCNKIGRNNFSIESSVAQYKQTLDDLRR